MVRWHCGIFFLKNGINEECSQQSDFHNVPVHSFIQFVGIITTTVCSYWPIICLSSDLHVQIPHLHVWSLLLLCT